MCIRDSPKTRPSLEDAIFAERNLDMDALVEDGMNKIETLLVSKKDELDNLSINE